MPPARFGIITDTHYAPVIHGNRHCEDSLDKIAAAISRFHAAGLVLVLNLGDNLGGSLNRYAEERFAAMAAAACGRFDGELRWVLGNHDVQTMTKTEYFAAIGLPGQSPFYSFNSQGVHFAVLDGNCHEDGRPFGNGDFDWEHAWVAPEQVDWLASDLAANGDRPAVVVCHECLDEARTNGVLDPHVVGNREAVREVIETAGNVRCVLHGHYHFGRRMLINGIPYVTFSALVIGAGLANNAFAVCTLHEDGRLAVQGHGRQASFVIGPGGIEA